MRRDSLGIQNCRRDWVEIPEPQNSKPGGRGIRRNTTQTNTPFFCTNTNKSKYSQDSWKVSIYPSPNLYIYKYVHISYILQTYDVLHFIFSEVKSISVYLRWGRFGRTVMTPKSRSGSGYMASLYWQRISCNISERNLLDSTLQEDKALRRWGF